MYKMFWRLLSYITFQYVAVYILIYIFDYFDNHHTHDLCVYKCVYYVYKYTLIFLVRILLRVCLCVLCMCDLCLKTRIRTLEMNIIVDNVCMCPLPSLLPDSWSYNQIIFFSTCHLSFPSMCVCFVVCVYVFAVLLMIKYLQNGFHRQILCAQ